MTGLTANQLIFVLCFTGGLAVSTDEAAAQIVPTGYTIPDITLNGSSPSPLLIFQRK